MEAFQVIRSQDGKSHILTFENEKGVPSSCTIFGEDTVGVNALIKLGFFYEWFREISAKHGVAHFYYIHSLQVLYTDGSSYACIRGHVQRIDAKGKQMWKHVDVMFKDPVLLHPCTNTIGTKTLQGNFAVLVRIRVQQSQREPYYIFGRSLNQLGKNHQVHVLQATFNQLTQTLDHAPWLTSIYWLSGKVHITAEELSKQSLGMITVEGSSVPLRLCYIERDVDDLERLEKFAPLLFRAGDETGLVCVSEHTLTEGDVFGEGIQDPLAEVAFYRYRKMMIN